MNSKIHSSTKEPADPQYLSYLYNIYGQVDYVPKSANINGNIQQECIPVGCVPSAAVAVCSGGGVSAQGDVFPGGCLPRRGVSAQEGGLPSGGVCPGGAVCQTPREQNHRHL